MQAASANAVVNTTRRERSGKLLVITDTSRTGGLLTARSIELYSRSRKRILIVGNMRKGLRLCYIAERETSGRVAERRDCPALPAYLRCEAGLRPHFSQSPREMGQPDQN